MKNIFKLHEYQTFALIKMHNIRKILFANNKFNLLGWYKKLFFMIFQRLSVGRNWLQDWGCTFNYTSKFIHVKNTYFGPKEKKPFFQILLYVQSAVILVSQCLKF